MDQKESSNTNVVDSVIENNVNSSVTDVHNIVEIPSDEDDIYLETLEDIKPNFSLEIDWNNHDVDDDKIKKSDEVIKRPAIEQQTDRFKLLASQGEIEQRASNNTPVKTRNQNKWALNAWEAWARWRNNERETAWEKYVKVPIDISDCKSLEEMGYWLSRFVLEVKRKDGKEYPFRSLHQMCLALQRHLRASPKHCDIILIDEKNPAFNLFYNALDSKMKELAKKGIVIEVNRADEISTEEESLLWEKGVINLHTAMGLSNGVYYYNCKLFGLRARDEHAGMKRWQLSIVADGKGREGIRYVDSGCKNWQGGLKHKSVTPKDITHWADTSNPRNLLEMYRRYFQCTPKTGDFYRRPIPTLRAEMPKFSQQCIGKNKLDQYVKNMFLSAGIPIDNRKITNHSIKATLCSTLWEAGFDNQGVSSRSGHRSRAVESYKRMRSAMENSISAALEPPRPKQSCSSKVSTGFCPKSSSTTSALVPSCTLTKPPTPSSSTPPISPVTNVPNRIKSVKEPENSPSWDLASVISEVRKAGGGNVKLNSDTKHITITID